MKKLIKSIPYLHKLLVWAFLVLYKWYTVAVRWSTGARRAISKRIPTDKLRVNLGAGSIWIRPGWTTLDCPSEHYGKYKHIDIHHDLMSLDPLPFGNESVDLFYSSHCVEHLPDSAVQYMFNEVHRCLKVGGTFRVTMPDYDLAYDAYVRRDEDFFSLYDRFPRLSHRFIAIFATYWVGRNSPMRSQITSIPKEILADSFTKLIPEEARGGGDHCNWWNFRKAGAFLKRAGFTYIYKSGPQKSRTAEMRCKGRVKGFDSTYPGISLYVEAVKNDYSEIVNMGGCHD